MATQPTAALRLDAAFLWKAMLAGGFVDASRRVLGEVRDGQPVDVESSTAANGVHRPPLLVAGSAFDAHGAIPEPPGDSADERRLALRRFERLSLAARVGLMTGPAGTREMEQDAPGAKALRDAAGRLDIHLERMPETTAEDVLEVLARAADALAPFGGGDLASTERAALRGGLQLIGVRIFSPERTSDGLNLVNARLPFSLRLVGCVVECPVLLPHAELVSLDLSGSALSALDVTGLITSGNVHLRRTVVRTPISFAGAKIAGSLNASDLVVAPFTSLPAQMPVDPDNGMLNLSRATIGSDTRLSRARIWGGLSLRGALIGRSLFMEDAVLVSPLAMLEKTSPDAPAGKTKGKKAVAAKTRATSTEVGDRLSLMDEALARKAFTPWNSKETDPNLVDMEIMRHFTRRWALLGQRTFQQLPLRALMTAVRADGLEVHGTIFARRIICNGKWRMKYAVVDGAIRMDDSLFRCPAEIKTNPEVSRHLASTLERFPDPHWVEEGDDVALDLRETTSRGDLSLGWEQDSSLDREKDDPTPAGEERDSWKNIKNRAKRAHSDIFGRVRMEGFSTQAAIRFRNTVFHAITAAAVAPPALSSPPVRSGMDLSPGALSRMWKAIFMRGRASSWTASRLLGLVVRDGLASIQPDLDLLWRRWVQVTRNPPQPETPFEKSPWRRHLSEAMTRPPALDMTQARTGRDVDLRGVVNVNGISLENAEIGGDLRLSEKAETAPFSLHRQGQIRCVERARNLHGHLNLRSAEIAGDALLVFSARTGPAISAAMMSVSGQLEIYPQINGRSYQFGPFHSDRSSPEAADARRAAGGDAIIAEWLGTVTDGRRETSFRLDRCFHDRTVSNPAPSFPPGLYCEACGAMVDKLEDNLAWTIDLRSAKATIFSHPPAAWPDPGGLRLEGFDYRQSSDIGPLSPPLPFIEDEQERQDVRRLRYYWRHDGWRIRAALGAILAIALILLSSTGIIWRVSSEAMGWLGRNPFGEGLGWLGLLMFLPALLALWVGLDSRSNPAKVLKFFALAAGLAVIGLMLAITERLTPVPGLVAMCSLFVAILVLVNLSMTLNPGKGFFSSRFEANPLALEYLARQRVAENRFKLRPSGYPVLESYARAARALRESGRYISANMVEEERLRKRTQMLSWRHHGAAKLLLTAVDLFSGYGFRLSRALTVLALIICSAGIGAHWAAANGYLVAVPSPETGIATLARTVDDHEPRAGGAGSASMITNPVDRAPVGKPREAVTDATPPIPVETFRCGWSPTASALKQDCPDFIYAADLLLPFIDLGEETRWETQIPARAEKDILKMSEPLQSLWVSFLRSWPALINALGLLLSAIMATAIAARVESAFARVEE